MEKTTGSDVEAIERTIKRLVEAFVSGDLEAFVNSFTEDTVCMLPGRPAAIGRDAWRSVMSGMFERVSLSNFAGNSEEIVVAGNWAFEWHNESFVVTDKETGDSSDSYHKGVFVLRRQPDKSWRIARYISNPNPAPED